MVKASFLTYIDAEYATYSQCTQFSPVKLTKNELRRTAIQCSPTPHESGHLLELFPLLISVLLAVTSYVPHSSLKERRYSLSHTGMERRKSKLIHS